TPHVLCTPAAAAAGKPHGCTKRPTPNEEPPLPPAVKTKPASAITATSATVNATVNPNGSEVTECKFEYGTTAAYGKSAPCSASPGSGMSPVAVSASLGSLTANTTYDFRIGSTNHTSEPQSLTKPFNTLLHAHPPPTPAPSANPTPTTAIPVPYTTLFRSVNPNGSEVTECKFEYGTTAAYGKSAPCSASPGSGMSPVAVSASLGSLTANTTYDFRIVATNAGGETQGGNESFKTLEEEVVTQPKAALRQLLEEVGSAQIPRRIRSQLTYLLRRALGSLGDGDCGAQAQITTTPMSVRRHQCRLGRAC